MNSIACSEAAHSLPWISAMLKKTGLAWVSAESMLFEISRYLTSRPWTDLRAAVLIFTKPGLASASACSSALISSYVR